MNPPLEEDLAPELQRLRPRQPSSALTRRIEQELSGPPGIEPRSIPLLPAWAWWGVAAAAAVLVGLAVVLTERTSADRQAVSGVVPTAQDPAASAEIPNQSPAVTPDAGETLRQVQRARYLLSAEDNGLIYVDDSLPVQTIRCRYVDSTQWRNDRENLTVELFVPRDGVVFLPVRVY